VRRFLSNYFYLLLNIDALFTLFIYLSISLKLVRPTKQQVVRAIPYLLTDKIMSYNGEI